MTDVEPTAEALAQELSIEDAKPETTEEVEDKFINLLSKNRKKWIDRPAASCYKNIAIFRVNNKKK